MPILLQKNRGKPMEHILRKKLGLLFIIMLMLSVFGAMAIHFTGSVKHTENNEKVTIVTSFYPIYIIALNLADGMEDVEVINLTENQTGCLHDYQLTTRDMRTLAAADIFVMNGGGMEAFAADILKEYPDIPVIVASEGMTFIEGSEHSHEHNSEENQEHSMEEEHIEEEEHNHEENAHVWMSIELYRQEIEQVAANLVKYDSKNKEKYQTNADIYLEKLLRLTDDLVSLSKQTEGSEIIIFNEAFAYLAESLGIEVVYILNLDGDSVMKAGEVAEIINEVKRYQIDYLWTEQQFAESIAASIASETEAEVLILNTLVSGESYKNSYIDSMNYNIDLLRLAFTSADKINDDLE